MAKNKAKNGARTALQRNKKTLFVVAGAVLVVAGGLQLMNLNQLNNELQIQQAAKLHRISFTGLTVRIDVILKNPTPGRITVLTPNIQLSYNGEQLAASDNISSTPLQLGPYSQLALEPIFITLDFLGLALRAKSFWEAYQSTGKAAITVRALTRINGLIPVEKTTTFDLSKSTPPAQGQPLLSGLPLVTAQELAFTPQRRSAPRRSF